MKRKLTYLAVLITVIVGTAFMTKNLSRPILLGDINNDNNINSMDMLMMKRHILDINELNKKEFIRADINRDGEITNLDMVMLKKYILAQDVNRDVQKGSD